LPAAVFLCSDRVDDNYPVEGNEEYLYKLYRTVALTFVDDGFDSTYGQLKGLANSFATKGKGDDTSIAGIIDIESVKAIAPLLRELAAADDRKAEEEKAAKAEAARLAAEMAESERAARPSRFFRVNTRSSPSVTYCLLTVYTTRILHRHCRAISLLSPPSPPVGRGILYLCF
jgi:hypothetical protein